jgi:hypothetical protein
MEVRMKVIQDALSVLKTGQPQVHLNLAFVPLLDEADPSPDYLLLDDALEKNLAHVTEVSAGGSVPELAFENGSPEKVLLVDGDELVGAKQNRVLNLTILVGGGKKLVIPVSCVEQGRWAYKRRDFQPAKRALFAKARAKKMAQVSESLRVTGQRRSNQSEIWKDVSEKAKFCAVESDTLAMSDVYEQSAHRLGDYAKAFSPAPRQRGAVVAIDGHVVGMELFDSPRTFARYFDKLVSSYALDAIETVGSRNVGPSLEEVREFLERIANAAGESFEALGEGTDIRFNGGGISGGALAAGGRVVHLAGFASV